MQPNTVNPDVVCQQTLQAKMEVYRAKEHFEAVLKVYNDNLDNMVNLVGLMKSRILELESQAATENTPVGKEAQSPDGPASESGA